LDLWDFRQKILRLRSGQVWRKPKKKKNLKGLVKPPAYGKEKVGKTLKKRIATKRGGSSRLSVCFPM